MGQQKFTAPVRRGLDYIREIAEGVIAVHEKHGHALKGDKGHDVECAIDWLRENGAQATNGGGGTDATQASASA